MPDHYRPKNLAQMDVRHLKLKEFLIKAVSPEMQDRATENKQDREAVHKLLLNAYENTKANLKPELRDRVIDSAQADLIGYGPLEMILPDPEISEIMVNGPKEIFVERDGELLETDVEFDDEEHLLRIIDRIVSPLGRRVDADNPTADARLPDGSRVNVIIPPVAVDGPHINHPKIPADQNYHG